MKKRWVIIIVALIVLAFASLFYLNFSGKIDLTKKFGVTGGDIEYGTYTNEEKIISEFKNLYLEGLQKGKEVYLVLGNREEIRILSYDEVYHGKVNLLLGNGQNMDINEKEYNIARIIPTGDNINIIINGQQYYFEVKEKENLYLIISQDIK